jgi:hypothetical protein
MRPLLSFPAPILLLVTGCERRVVTSDYFPMRDGNRWEYRFLDARMLARLAKGQEVQTAPATTEARVNGGPPKSGKAEVLSLEAEGTAGDDRGSDTETGPAPGGKEQPVARRIVLALKERRDDLTYRASLAGTEQVWSKRDGYVGFQNSRGRHYWLILPPHTGYRWIVTDPDGHNLYYEIEGHEEVKTPAGLFRFCAVVRQESRDRRIAFKFWFAEGVGLVRRSKYYLKEEVFRQELVDYRVRPSSAVGRRAEEREIQRALKGKRRGKEFFRKSGSRKDARQRPRP